MSKIAISAVVLAIAGGGLTIGGMSQLGFDPKALSGAESEYTESYAFAVEEVQKWRIEMPYGQVKIQTSNEVESIVVDAESNQKEEWKFAVEEACLHIRGSGFEYEWWNMFGNWNKKMNLTITVPEDYFVSDLHLSVSAGTIEIDGLSFGSVFTSLSAGNIVLSDIRGTRFQARNSAGTTKISRSDVEELDLDVSAGEFILDLIRFDRLRFDISAGSLEADVIGSLEEYTVDIDVSAGDCNLLDRVGTTEKSIQGDISAGSARFDFTE